MVWPGARNLTQCNCPNVCLLVGESIFDFDVENEFEGLDQWFSNLWIAMLAGANGTCSS